MSAKIQLEDMTDMQLLMLAMGGVLAAQHNQYHRGPEARLKAAVQAELGKRAMA